MIIKYNKIIRKYSKDFWNRIKFKRKKNKFWVYYKKFIIRKILKRSKKRKFIWIPFKWVRSVVNENISKRIWKRVALKKLISRERQETNFFGLNIMRPVIRLPRRFRTRFGKILTVKKSLYYFYGNLRKSDIRLMKRRLSKKGNVGQKIMNILESQLCVIVYRMNFVRTVQEGFFLVKKGYFMVNKKLILKPRYLVKPGDIIEVIDDCKVDIILNIRRNIKRKGLFMLYVKFVEVDYILLMGIYLSYPKKEQLFFPFKFNKNFYSILYNARF